jgi:hypothetical protein
MVMIVIEDGRDDGYSDGSTTLITWYGSPTSSCVNFSMSSTLFDRLFDFVCERFEAAVLIKEFRSRPGAPSS